MDTEIEGTQPQTAAAGRTSGIVRATTSRGGLTLRSLVCPLIAAALVVAIHAATVRLDAWLPLRAVDTGSGLDGLASLSTAAAWLASVAEVPAWGLIGLSWPTRLVVVALGATALAIAGVARFAARSGLPAIVGGLLALVAAGGPLMWGQATTPTGTALLTALSAGLLLLAPVPMPRRTFAAALVFGLVGLVLAAVTVSGEWGRAGAAITVIRQDLGGPGLMLAALGLGHPLGAGLVAAAVLSLGIAAPLGTTGQAAAGLPWVWALVACGIGTLLDWRGGPFTRARMAWLAVAVIAWAGVQASGRPWVARAQSTQMSATWAEAVAEVARSSAVVQGGAADTDALVNAWLRERAPDAPRPTLREAHALGGGTTALLLPELIDRARWMGLPPADVPAALAPLADVINTLPRDVIVVVGIGTQADARLTADDWQALGKLGARPSAVGHGRARALMSITGRRLQGDDVSSSERAVLERLPGDPIGSTGLPSPLDMRLDVGTRDIALLERGRVRAIARDTLVVVYRKNGALLGFWVGAGGRDLGAGRPGTLAPAIRRVAQVLPCRLVPAGTEVAVEDLSGNGALGVEAPAGARLSIATAWSDGGPDAHPRRVDNPPGPAPPADNVLSLTVSDAGPFGVDLRGRPAGVNVRADAAARVCAAAPLAPVLSLAEAGDVRVHPRAEGSFGRGWHDMEPLGAGQYFRWSSGRAANLLWTLETAPPPNAAITLAFDLQNAGTPGPDDRLQLAVNGERLGAQPLAEGRGLYSWTIPGAAFGAGLNEVRLDTTLAVRPSDLQPGADGRRLGFALYGWRVRCTC